MAKKLLLKRSSFLLALQVLGVSPILAAGSLDELSLEELTKTEITSVSRKSQNLANVPAAAFVISSEDIRRSGAQTVPDALRMAPGIQVAQIDNGRYAVSARGFNGRFANKLQVLVDGRSIYYPTFSGVMWENDVISLEDIERIEVIRGQGAAVWGVNAVNGVINIISKHSRDQQGVLLVPTVGTNRLGNLYARVGATLDENTSWKLSAQGRHAEPSQFLSNRETAEDRLNNATVDARFDKKLGAGSDLAVWANALSSSLGDMMSIDFSPTPPLSLRPYAAKQLGNSQTLGGRYRWLTDGGIESSLQTAYQSSVTEIEHFYKDERNTFDLDYQGRYTFAQHDLLWGLSYRSTSDAIATYPGVLTFMPRQFTQRTQGFFMQDEWTLIPETLQFGLGARWDYTNLGGNSFAPNATLMWTPTRRDALWAKYAQAPRMPSRAEQTVNIFHTVIPASQQMPVAVIMRNSTGGSTLGAEKKEGVELGYRTYLSPSFNLDLSAYRYRYTDQVGGRVSAYDPLTFYPLALIQDNTLCNCANGWIKGSEVSADWLVLPNWRLQLSYSWIRIDMDDSSNPLVNAGGKVDERGTPHHYGSLRSQWSISARQQFDLWLRGSAGYDRLNAPYPDSVHVPGYLTLDLRYAHKLNKDLEIALIGRNLIGQRRTEFVSDYIPSLPVEIAPSLLLSARWKF